MTEAEKLALSSNDPIPPIDTIIQDHHGAMWVVGDPEEHRRVCSPILEWDSDNDPESWIRVAGNYGPVEVITGKYLCSVCESARIKWFVKSEKRQTTTWYCGDHYREANVHGKEIEREEPERYGW